MLLLACITTSCAFPSATPPPYPTFLEPPETRHLPAESDAPDADEKDMEAGTGEARRGEPVAMHLTLADAVAQCLAADPRIRAGAEQLEQARADLWTASLVPNPTLDTGISLFPLFDSFTVDHQGGPPQFDVGLAFPVDWLLFGKRAASVQLAHAGVDVAAAELADLIRQRLAATIAAFYAVLEARALLELARQDLESLERLQRITAELVDLGGAGTIENDRVRVALLDSQRDVRRREADLAIAQAALLAQLGRRTPARALEVDGALAVTSPAPPVPAGQAFHLAARHRPDAIAARLRVAEASSAVRKAETDAFPDVTPRLGYTRQFQSKSIGFPDVNAFGAGVELTLPTFDRNQGTIARARSALVQSQNDLRAQLADIRAEVEEATRTYQFAYETVTADAPLRIETARNARDKIEAAYRAGGRPLIDVLDAQRAFRDTQRLDIEDHAQYWQSLYRLNAAVGREVLR